MMQPLQMWHPVQEEAGRRPELAPRGPRDPDALTVPARTLASHYASSYFNAENHMTTTDISMRPKTRGDC